MFTSYRITLMNDYGSKSNCKSFVWCDGSAIALIEDCACARSAVRVPLRRKGDVLNQTKVQRRNLNEQCSAYEIGSVGHINCDSAFDFTGGFVRTRVCSGDHGGWARAGQGWSRLHCHPLPSAWQQASVVILALHTREESGS